MIGKLFEPWNSRSRPVFPELRNRDDLRIDTLVKDKRKHTELKVTDVISYMDNRPVLPLGYKKLPGFGRRVVVWF
jgi:hypothetical protein